MVGMRNLAFLEEAEKEDRKYRNPLYPFSGLHKRYCIITYFFNSISNPQLKVIPP